MNENKEIEQLVQKPGHYTKKQFLRSQQRSGKEKDILSVVLEDNKTYTNAEAERLTQTFLKKGVN